MALFALLAWALVTRWETTPPEDLREPFAPFSGVSSWPGQLLRTLMIVLFACFLDYAWCHSADDCRRIGREYFGARIAAGSAADRELVATPANGMVQQMGEAEEPVVASGDRPQALRVRQAVALLQEYRQCNDLALAPAVVRSDGSIDGAHLWRHYGNRLRNWPRVGRIVFWWIVAGMIFYFSNHIAGATELYIPARGFGDRNLFLLTLGFSGLALIILFVLVADATILTWRVVYVMKDGRTTYPWATVERFAAELGPELRDLAAAPIAARIADRHGYGPAPAPPGHPGRNSLLDDWIDARLIAEHTAAIGPLIVFPFILLALAVVARSPIFDNWAIGGDYLAVLILYVLWAVAMAAMLNIGAEMTRRKAIAGMEADLLWLKGAGPDYARLAGRFPDLIAQVRTLRQGAFAPFFEQPLVQAILVPLGGAGGVQLVEYLMFARAQ